MQSRETLIKKVEREFEDLESFAIDSWSNKAIVARLEALHETVRHLYITPDQNYVPPLRRRKRKAQPAPEPAKPFTPVHVDKNTRWG